MSTKSLLFFLRLLLLLLLRHIVFLDFFREERSNWPVGEFTGSITIVLFVLIVEVSNVLWFLPAYIFLAVINGVSIIAVIKYLTKTNVGKGKKGESR